MKTFCCSRKFVRWTAAAALLLGLLVPALPAHAVTTSTEPEKLTKVMEEQMLEFVKNNYPTRMTSAVRSLQSGEGRLHESLTETVGFISGFAAGPVTLEGRWEGSGNCAKYLMLSVVRGVQNYPNATVIFKTCPGLFKPFTVVEIDSNGDGTVDEQSAALGKREKVFEWVAQHFPQAACAVRAKR